MELSSPLYQSRLNNQIRSVSGSIVLPDVIERLVVLDINTFPYFMEHPELVNVHDTNISIFNSQEEANRRNNLENRSSPLWTLRGFLEINDIFNIAYRPNFNRFSLDLITKHINDFDIFNEKMKNTPHNPRRIELGYLATIFSELHHRNVQLQSKVDYDTSAKIEKALLQKELNERTR